MIRITNKKEKSEWKLVKKRKERIGEELVPHHEVEKAQKCFSKIEMAWKSLVLKGRGWFGERRFF